MGDVIETERLMLRRFTPADIDELVALHNDPEVMRYLTGGAPIARAEIEREVDEVFAGDGYRVATEWATGAWLGWFALHPTADRPPDELELGYRLHRAAWGRGYATEGARALIDRAFATGGARRVWAQTMAVNRPSRRVMERAGLTFVRVFHVAWDDPLPGTEEGEVEYALDRADWSRRRTGTAPG